MGESKSMASSQSSVRGFFVVVFLLALLPLSVSLVVFSNRLSPGLPILLGGVLAMAVGLWRVVKGSERYYHWGQDVAVVFLVWAAICCYFGALDAYLSAKALSILVGGVALLTVPQLAVKTAKELRVAAHFSVGLVTIYSLASWPKMLAAMLSGDVVSPLKGTFANPDTFAILPMLAIATGMGLAENVSKRWMGPFYVQLSFLAVTLLATGCRSAILGLFVGGAVFFWKLAVNRDSDFQKSRAVLVIPIIVALMLLPLINMDSQVLGKFSHTFTSQALRSQSLRWEILTNGWKAVVERPLFGAGPGCFGLSYQAVRPPIRDGLYVDIAHNDHIEVAAELGLLGFVLWVILWWAAFSKVSRALLKGRRPVPAAGLMAALVAAVTYACFNFIMIRQPVQWYMLLTVGFALSYPSSRSVVVERRVLRFGFGTILLILGAWSVWFGTNCLQSDKHYQKARDFERSLLLENAKAEYDKAWKLEPRPVILSLKQDRLLRKISSFRQQPSDTKARRFYLEKALENSPRDQRVLLGLVELELGLGNFKQAESLLAQAESYAPGHEKVERKQVALLLRAGRLTEAARKFVPYSQGPRDSTKEISAMVVAAELQERGQGATLVKEWLSVEGQQEWAESVLSNSIESSIKKEQWLVAQSLLTVQLAHTPDDFCARRKAAQALGHLEGAVAEFEFLDSSFGEEAPQLGKCYEDYVARWSELGLKQDQGEKVAARLREIVTEQPRVEMARVRLAEFEIHQGRGKLAVKLLRAGLSSNPRSKLLVLKLAQVYEQMGSRELAISYYRDAHNLMPGDSKIKQKLSELVRSRD